MEGNSFLNNDKDISSAKPDKTLAKVLSVTGTTVGCGKTAFSLFAAIHLAKMGKKTLLVDFREGASHIPRFFGISSPNVTLADHYLKGSRVDSLVTSTPVKDLKFLPIGKLPKARRERVFLKRNLISLLKNLDYDYVVNDMGMLSDRRMINYFLLSDHQIAVTPATEGGVGNLLELCMGLAVGRFEHMARKNARIREAVQTLKGEWSPAQGASLSAAAIIKNRYPEFEEDWAKAGSNSALKIVVNYVSSPAHVENIGVRIQSSFNEVSPPKIMCLPEFTFRPSFADGRAVPFVDSVGAVTDDVCGFDELGEARMGQILERGFAQAGDREDGWIKTHNFQLLDVASENIEAKTAEREAEIETEIDRIRMEKLEQMARKVDTETSRRRMTAVVAMEKELAEQRREKFEAVQARVKEREAELGAELSVEMERRHKESDESLAQIKDARLREIDAIMDAYYRNAKVSADAEIAQARKLRQSEMDSEFTLQKKKRMAKMEVEFAAEVDKVREMLWQQLEVKHRARLEEINEAVDQYRRSRMAAVDTELNSIKEDGRRELEAEVARSSKAFLDDVRREAMELYARLDVDEAKNAAGVVARVAKLAATETDKHKKRISDEVDALKKEKEAGVELYIREERGRQSVLLTGELSKQRESMLDSMIADMRHLKEREMGNVTAEITRLREAKLKQADQDILAEIRRKTEAMSSDLRDLETALNEEMRERVRAEEEKFRASLKEKIVEEAAEEEAHYKRQIKNALDAERDKLMRVLQKDVSGLRSAKEDELGKWEREERQKFASQVKSILAEEERFQRVEMFARLDNDSKRMADELALERKKLEEEAHEKLRLWVEQRKAQASANIERLADAERDRLFAEMSERVSEVKIRRMAELQNEMEIEKQRRMGEIALETNKMRDFGHTELEAEIRGLRDSKMKDLDRLAMDESKRMDERLEKRYVEMMRKKEEWLEFEAKRRLLEMNSAIERDVEAEKGKMLSQKLAGLEEEMVGRRKQAMAEVEEAKTKLTRNLIDEIDLHRKMLVRKVTAGVRGKIGNFKKEVVKRLEETKAGRAVELEKELLALRQRRVAQIESEISEERKIRLEDMVSSIKAEYDSRRQEIIGEMIKKKGELEVLYEQERKNFFEKLQKEILSNKGVASQYLEAEIDRLQKSWRHN